MDERNTMWRHFAQRFPRSYLAVHAMMFYGTFSLTTEVASSLGFDVTRPWPPKVLSALLAGGAMLWIARRSSPSAAAAP